jgi:hypothetical protein
LNFQVGSNDLRLGVIRDGVFIEGEIAIEPESTLSSQGQAQLAVDIVDSDGKRVTSAETVRFASECLSVGRATLDPPSPILTNTGSINTTYNAGRCVGEDGITATLVGTNVQAFGTVSVAEATANRLIFQSATPELIVLKGTGGGENRQEFSDVVFRAVDANNDPLPGIRVNFELTTYVGGLSLAPSSAVSDSDGLVRVTVFSGDVATVVRVIATTDSGTSIGEVSTISDILTVSTGLPDQNSISLSVAGGFVVEDGYTTDGVTREITVSMADKFNNPVPDGTAAVFTTEYGAIESSCTTTNGTCTVTWRSQEPRFPTLTGDDNIVTINNSRCPSLSNNSGPCPDDLGFTRGGRSTVLVTAIGEESFIDRNGNGIMDEAERDLFDNVPEAWIDHNEDDVYTPEDPACQGSGSTSSRCIAGQEEIFTDFNNNGDYDLNDDPAVYNGLLCPTEGDGEWCSRELVNVRDDLVLILSADPAWDIALYRGSARASGTRWDRGPYTAYISDIFNGRPPAGSTVTVEVTDDCELLSESSFEVPNTSRVGAFSIDITTGGVGEQAGTVTITLEPSGDGVPYTETFSCTPEPPPPPEEDGDNGGGDRL